MDYGEWYSDTADDKHELKEGMSLVVTDEAFKRGIHWHAMLIGIDEIDETGYTLVSDYPVRSLHVGFEWEHTLKRMHGAWIRYQRHLVGIHAQRKSWRGG